MPKPSGNLRTCTFLPKSARKGSVFVAPDSKDMKTAQPEEQEYYFHIGTGQRAATALDMQAGTKNLAPTTSCKQWSLLQNSLPSGPLSREAPQVSEQPLRINSFGTMRSANLMSKHFLNNPHDVFCLKCWWGIQHSASALCHHEHCAQRACRNLKDLLNIPPIVGVHQRIQEKNILHRTRSSL